MPHEVSESSRVDTGLASLAILSRLHEIPADIRQLRHEFTDSSKVCNTRDILRAAKYLGLKARAVETRWDKLKDLTLPAICRHRDGRYFVIAKVDQDRVLIHDPLEKRPLTLPRDIFESAWSGELILITRRSSPLDAFRKFDISWFVPEVLRYKKLMGEVLLASFFIQVLALISPLFFQVIIDKVLVHRGLTTLDVLALGLIAVSVFEIILSVLRGYVLSHTVQRIDVKLGAKLFRHMLSLPLSYFESRRVGDSVARAKEIESIRRFLTGSALSSVLDLFFVVVFLAVMYYFSPMLTWIVIGSLPLYVVLSLIVTPILRDRLNDKFNRGAEHQAFLVESIHGIQTVKAMAVEPQMRRRWEEQLADYVRTSFRADNLSNVASQLAGFLNKITYVVLLWVGARLVLDGQLTIGQLVAFNMLAGRVSAPVLRIVQLWQEFQQAGISVERLGDILNTHPEPGINSNRAVPAAIQGRVTLENVTFRYRPDSPEILRQVSLDVPAGQIIGIVGRSGSGKSTLTKLVQRLYVPEGGRVTVDGLDLALLHPSWLRRQVGVVLQESFLFNKSVRDNIALSDPGTSMDDVIAAAQLAGAHEFILQLPEGYDTIVGEHGGRLSGGQRQCIAIARALITNPRIVIFDEATSALDYESERIIQDNMKSICSGRTVFIIAHRLSTVRVCDRIVVMDKGQIVEQGTHADLLQQPGIYTKLHQYQAGV
ncbi:MAG: type I secretion system permease/ATPase [Gammaproteobacteria bacterium]|nr:type I secretion system permease/ATPase [Gammaproteobacteria bacterium]